MLESETDQASSGFQMLETELMESILSQAVLGHVVKLLPLLLHDNTGALIIRTLFRGILCYKVLSSY